MRSRIVAGIGSLLAALVLALLPLPQGQAQAAAADDSAVTKAGTKGPYDDFSDLEVTVHQTNNLRGQGVQVTWTGGKPASGYKYVDYLQLMQCWGDDPDGPSREQCEFGDAPPSPLFSGLRVLPKGTDPLETQYTDGDVFSNPFVPFRPVHGDPTTSATDHTYFSGNDTNAQSWAPDGPDGGGDTVFEMKSSRESPHLGCGARTTSSGAVQPCWLVVVPRGEHDPDGTSPSDRVLRTSALSQSNWNQRIVFRLDFLPVGDSCAADQQERRMIGSELVTDAITSWQSALCKGGGSRFVFTQSGEEYARSMITNPTSSSPGLAFTLDPVQPPDGAAPVVHAPVAVSGLTVGFIWEDDNIGGRVKDLRLNARLLAKLLTESYIRDVRLVAYNVPAPEHLSGNPDSIVMDPEFRKLNPVFDTDPIHRPKALMAIMVTADTSDANRLVWRYLQSDNDAREFLKGTPDPWGMKINPYFKELNLASDAPDDFPKADPTTTDASAGVVTLPYGVTDIGPYAQDMHDGALRVRRADTGSVFRIGDGAGPPKLVGETLVAGDRRVWGITDAASASRYQLDVAALADADGEYVKPTTSAMLKAVSQMPDSPVAGVKAATPAKARNGAYPLTSVVYAATSTDRPKEVRADYARVIRYAAGAGQQQGTARGQLPFGYAPLPAALRQQAEKAADVLEKGKAPVDSGTTGGSHTGAGGGSGGGGGTGGTDSGGGSGSGSGGGTGSGGGPGSAGSAGGAAGAASSSPNPDTSDSAHPTAPGQDPAKQSVASSGGLTPATVLGIVRWVLLGVLVAGGVAALAGPVMLRLSVRRTG
ncbi:hypothetical protein [Streptomyces nodosus]|uniref:hypothetical protein n=1 Tax=Streptomyces nodosus TaxID=40318 RepID=UPI0036E14328